MINKNAIILSAGFGSRFLPLSHDIPKGLIRVKGEILIERQIRQMIEAGISEIAIVVGYKKEAFNYLIPKYGVRLIYNPDYSTKNNLSSLFYSKHLLKNTIVSVSDIWMENNIFFNNIDESWYCTNYISGKTDEWCVITDENNYIKKIEVTGQDAWVMMGPAYINAELNKKLIPWIEKYYKQSDSLYWENILIYHLEDISMLSFRQPQNIVFEFENMDELRLFDHSYCKVSNNSIMSYLSDKFQVEEFEIHSFKPLKSGMTNQSFSCVINGQTYVVRICKEEISPIDRKQEYDVYRTLENYIKDNKLDSMIEEVCFFDKKTGIKVSKFLNNTRESNPDCQDDIEKSMAILKVLHDYKIKVDYVFDFINQIQRYEAIVDKQFLPENYSHIKENILLLLKRLSFYSVEKTLCHVDSVFSNILISDDKTYLIDWEYAAMSDPLIDVAMYALFANYDQKKLEYLSRIYLDRHPTKDERTRIYTYMAAGGFLWGLWSDCKQSSGVKFSHYRNKQYEYAQTYYLLLQEEK